MNIVVPLAGRDENFEELGEHKVLTKVFNKAIIEWIAESRPFDLSRAIFVLLRAHEREFDIENRLRRIFGSTLEVVWAEEMTDGAPQSVLLCSDKIDNDKPLVIDLADQYIDFGDICKYLQSTDADGVIPTFESLYYNRGYMEIDETLGQVLRVSEKDRVPISTHSTACVSFFRKGSEFVWAANKMIEKEHVAANGAYLISLVFNELIDVGKIIKYYPCEFIAPLGSVEGVQCFERIVRPVHYEPDEICDNLVFPVD